MTDSTSLENLKACRDAVNEFKRILLQNEQITKNNEDKQALYRADHGTWKNLKQAFDDKLSRWKNKTGEYSHWNDKLASKDDNFWPEYCWGTGGCRDIQNSNDTVWQCGKRAEILGKYDPWGYTSDGNTQACGYDDGGCIRNRRMRCSRSETSKQKINNDYNADMPTFTKPEPIEKVGAYAHDPTIPNDGNVQCCANIFKINTGDVNNVKQSCSQQIDQAILTASTTAPAATAPPAANAPAAATAPPAANAPAGSTTSLNSEAVNSPDTNDTNNNQTFVIIAVIAIILLSIFSISSILSIFMIDSDDTDT